MRSPTCANRSPRAISAPHDVRSPRGAASRRASSRAPASRSVRSSAGPSVSIVQVLRPPFWFTVFPGPAGAVLYRAAALLAAEWQAPVAGAETTPIMQARAVFGGPARALLFVLDWIPVRLTALSFAIVGDFEDAALCWRTQ